MSERNLASYMFPSEYRKGMMYATEKAQAEENLKVSQRGNREAGANEAIDFASTLGVISNDGFSLNKEALNDLALNQPKQFAILSTMFGNNNPDISSRGVDLENATLSFRVSDTDNNTIADLEVDGDYGESTLQKKLARYNKQGYNVSSAFVFSGKNADGSDAVITDGGEMGEAANNAPVTRLSLTELNENIAQSYKLILANSSRPVMQMRALDTQIKNSQDNNQPREVIDALVQKKQSLENFYNTNTQLGSIMTYLNENGQGGASRDIMKALTDPNKPQEAKDNLVKQLLKDVQGQMEADEVVAVKNTQTIADSLKYFDNNSVDPNILSILPGAGVADKAADLVSGKRSVLNRVIDTANLIAEAAPGDSFSKDYIKKTAELNALTSSEDLLKEAEVAAQAGKGVSALNSAYRKYNKTQGGIANFQQQLTALQGTNTDNMDQPQKKAHNRKIAIAQRGLNRAQNVLDQAKSTMIAEHVQESKDPSSQIALQYRELFENKNRAGLNLISKTKLSEFTKDDPNMLIEGVIDGSYKIDQNDVNAAQTVLQGENSLGEAIGSLNDAARLSIGERLQVQQAMLFSAPTTAEAISIYNESMQILFPGQPNYAESITTGAEFFGKIGYGSKERREDEEIMNTAFSSGNVDEINNGITASKSYFRNMERGLKALAGTPEQDATQAFYQEQEREYQSLVFRAVASKNLYAGIFSTDFPGGKEGISSGSLTSTGDETSFIRIKRNSKNVITGFELVLEGGREIGGEVKPSQLRSIYGAGPYQRFLENVKANNYNQGQ